ncbi:MAG: type II toxin-antitoxin system RelE/ParE family toxin [Deltaproteobacteria bacterium]|nr:type II toxin-antitoxin system RelE/ParE family toxin [Deltaproteobacteria bacterium]
MAWDVEYTDEFGVWWDGLTEQLQDDIDVVVDLLQERGPNLEFPYSSVVSGTAFSHMRELRVQHKGEPYRILYAFDPKRSAILLIGGCKTGDGRWYEKFIPIADRLYTRHLEEMLKEEGKG